MGEYEATFEKIGKFHEQVEIEVKNFETIAKSDNDIVNDLADDIGLNVFKPVDIETFDECEILNRPTIKMVDKIDAEYYKSIEIL